MLHVSKVTTEVEKTGCLKVTLRSKAYSNTPFPEIFAPTLIPTILFLPSTLKVGKITYRHFLMQTLYSFFINFLSYPF